MKIPEAKIELIRENSTPYHQDRVKFSNQLYNSDELMPFRYVFILTNKCNLKCTFCFQQKRKLSGALTLRDWINVVEQLPEDAWVTLTGGEPFAFKQFNQIFHKVASHHQCNIISNGLLLNKEIINKLLSYNNFKILSISIDDIGNKVRGVTTEQWEHLVKMLKYFSIYSSETNSEALLDVKTVILDSNTNNLFEIYRYCVEELNVNTHSFQLLKGSPIQFSDLTFSFESIFEQYDAHRYKNPETIVEQLNKVREYNLSKNKVSFVHPKIINLYTADKITDKEFANINAKPHKSSYFKPCRTPWESMHINTDGSVIPCMAVNMGNIKKYSLKQIVMGEKYRRFKSIIREYGTVNGCNRCGYLLFK